MTEKTDIEALRDKHEIALRDLTERLKECNRLNFCMDELSAFAAFSSTVIDQLEAERQQREAAEKELRIRSHQLVKADASVEDLEAELAALRGTQEPVAFLIHEKARPSRLSFRNLKGFVSDADIVEHELWQEPLFTRQPKPVVVLTPPINPLMFNSDVMFGYNKARSEDKVAIEFAGIVVKDGQ